MESIIFITEKRDGRIKGHACANGNIKQDRKNKEEVSRTTVALESVILMVVIDTHEERGF